MSTLPEIICRSVNPAAEDDELLDPATDRPAPGADEQVTGAGAD